MGLFDFFHHKNILKKIENKNKIVWLSKYVFCSFFVALIYNMFFVPNNLVTGGMGGLAIVVKELTGLSTSIFLIASTSIILILSYIFLGKQATKKNIVGATIYPIMATITEPLSKLVEINFDSLLLTVLFSGLIYSIFLGIIYKVGYSTGGGDILNQIMCKYAKISVGQAGNIINLIIVFIAVFVIGIPKAIYAVFTILLINKIVDFILLGNSDSKLCIIKTKNVDYLEHFLKDDFNIGYSVLESSGGVEKKKRRTIMCVVTSREYYRFKHLILDIDPNAFFVTHDCYEVLGGNSKRINIC